jgi:hypothetical protein
MNHLWATHMKKLLQETGLPLGWIQHEKDSPAVKAMLAILGSASPGAEVHAPKLDSSDVVPQRVGDASDQLDVPDSKNSWK